MKRASYREAVDFIAFNDGWGDHDAYDVEAVSGVVTVGLVARIFGVENERVAADVVRSREKADENDRAAARRELARREAKV